MDNKELLAWAVYKFESETEQIEFAKIKIRGRPTKHRRRSLARQTHAGVPIHFIEFAPGRSAARYWSQSTSLRISQAK
jgi:hypothetical protein